MDPLAASDAVERMRLDCMILFDLRLWKEMRIKLRDLLISTVVNVPQFKRVLGIRFALLYTTLSQLYLVADREPDHSVIHLAHNGTWHAETSNIRATPRGVTS